MPIGKKIRIYDLARDLKQDAKRVMEDLRREGADVSVPSNSVSLELAEKVRLKYFPKTEVAPKRGIKIIKATKKVDAEPTPEEVVAPVEPSPQEVVEVKAEEPTPITPDEATAPVRKVLKKKAVKEPAETEPIPQIEVEETPAETIEQDVSPEVEPATIGDTVPAGRVLSPSGTQIKQLT